MIIKHFEINKINLDKTQFILFYGKNEGLKNQIKNKYFIFQILTIVMPFKLSLDYV